MCRLRVVLMWIVPARCCATSQTVKWGSSAPGVPVRDERNQLKTTSTNGKWFHQRLKHNILSLNTDPKLLNESDEFAPEWVTHGGKTKDSGLSKVTYLVSDSLLRWRQQRTGRGCPLTTPCVWWVPPCRRCSSCAGWTHCRSAPPPPKAPWLCAGSLSAPGALYRWRPGAVQAVGERQRNQCDLSSKNRHQME